MAKNKTVPKELKFLDENGRIIKKQLIVDTTDTIELTLTKGNVKLILFRMPFALFMVHSNLLGSSWPIMSRIKVEKKHG